MSDVNSLSLRSGRVVQGPLWKDDSFVETLHVQESSLQVSEQELEDDRSPRCCCLKVTVFLLLSVTIGLAGEFRISHLL